jgi:hypothetical protein
MKLSACFSNEISLPHRAKRCSSEFPLGQSSNHQQVIMKTSHSFAKTTALTAAISLFSLATHADLLPTGTISAASKVIQVGQVPTISWSIIYPKKVDEVITIPTTPSDPVVTKVKLRTSMRVIGQGVTAGANTFCRTKGFMSLNTSSFKTIFDGVNANVTATEMKLDTLFGSAYSNNILPAGTRLRFGGQYRNPYSGEWSSPYRTGDGTTNVRTLIAGDTPPAGLGISDGPSLESFLRPYLNSAGKVNIGPMDMIVFMELTHPPSDSTSSGYDFQDLLYLLSFAEVPAN